jgi:hypothetical protein
MRIVYKPYMLRWLHAAMTKAAMEDREIEKAVLTDEEYHQLMSETEPHRPYTSDRKSDIITVFGIKIERERK